MTLDVFDDDAIERGVAVMRASRDDASDDASDDAELLASAPDWLLAWFLRDRKLDARRPTKTTPGSFAAMSRYFSYNSRLAGLGTG